MCSITVIKIVNQLSIGFGLKEFEELKLGEINFEIKMLLIDLKIVLVQQKITYCL